MSLLRCLIALLFAAALLLSGAPMYSVAAVTAAQQERSAGSEKPTHFHYVCPMHDDVNSKKPGLCRKCRMKLVKKPVPQVPSQ